MPALMLAGGAAAIHSPAAAQVQGDTTAPYVAPVPTDTGSRWMPDPAGVFLGHYRITPPALSRPLFGPRLRNERIQLHWTDLSGSWWQDVDASLTGARDKLWIDSHGLVLPEGTGRQTVAVAPDSVQYLPYREPEEDSTGATRLLPGAVGQYADLGMLVTGRGEMGGAWQRFEPCDAIGVNTCEQGLAPRLRPDLQFGVLLGGTITDRVHVAVDYDQAREFDAANNINVYYQGLEDEILQRFEMGDVSITMPQSQYLTGGIPGGNFGFRALAQLGPVELQSVWAQQQGDIGSLDINIDARTGGLYEENTITIDDHDYASGRFYFLVDPAQLPGYPHVDVLALEAVDAPDSIRPRGGTFQLYRDEQLPVSQQNASQVFRADASPPDPSETSIGGYFRRLAEDDFVVHSSGLWLMLRQPLGPNEALAMSYVTETGDTVGTIDAGQVSNPADIPVLQLLRGATSEHHPGVSTWDWEMHQVYQMYAGELEAQDLEVKIKLGDAVQGQPYVDYAGAQVPLLRLFGADENSPVEHVDPERLFHPSEFSTGSAITGTYLVFPTLRPFAEPPPTRELTAQQAAEALGANANEAIYEERDPDLRSVARFRMALAYRVRTDGLVSEFSLGGFGVREGSERLFVDGQALRRGTDYTVDYQTGMVRLTNPQQLFAGRQSPRITAQFEQNALFEIAPKSIFGTTARWRLGQAGEVNMVGLYQNQRSVMTRPQLGNEPSSIMMGGMTTNLRFGAGWMDRALDAIPALRLAGESHIGMTGELAMSLPNPNTRGSAYLDDFEATAEIPIGMNQRLWRLGSVPDSRAGAAEWLPLVLDTSTAFRLAWQHQAIGAGGATYGAVDANSVDRQIQIAGRDVPEPVLYLTMQDDPDRSLGARVWRSMTTVLSARGSDLTSSEYFEFYAAESSSDIALVFDLGIVSEDAFYFDTAQALTGTHPVTGQPWGRDILDREADFDQPWGVDLDHGLWNQAEFCETEPGRLTVLGSPHANCTENNGINDTEDLNGDGVGSFVDGAYFRYVVPIGPNSPYLARDHNETGSEWRLYRIPLRGPNAIALNNAGDDTWRTVRHLRMTVTSGNCTDAGGDCRADALLLARMRISGSTWKKRDIEGVLAGVIGTDTIPGDHSENVHVGPVSRLTDGNAYLGPPGTADRSSDPSQEIGATGVEVNEKGLRIALTDLEPDTRAEVFYRFPSETRSFMDYQQLRLWALPRAGDWGPDGTLSLLVKIGTDDGNYYLYRTRLRPPIENRDIDQQSYWLPEVVVDFSDWFELKARAETLAVTDRDTARVVWNDDSTHAIVLTRRAQSPNLAAIRELSLAVHNDAGLPVDSAELWINDLRLTEGRSDVGFAGTFALDATAADFASFRFSYANQDAVFHPMDRQSTLEGASDIGMSGRFELGHFAPAGWGVAMPVTVQHTRQDRTPEFLNRTDIHAADLEGLRESGSSATQVGLSLSKTTPAASPWLGLLLDGTRLSLNWGNAERDAFTSSSASSQFNGSLAYEHQLRPRLVDVTPSFFVSLLELIAPARIEQSEFFRRVAGAQLRWSPASVGFSTSYLDRKSETLSFGTVLEGPADTAIRPLRSPQQDIDNTASIGFRPFESLSARIGMSSARDLLGGADLQATRFGQQAVEAERFAPGGMDLGWEKSRSLTTSTELQPRIANWLRPTIGWSSEYRTSRTPHYLDLEIVSETVGDSVVTDTIGGTMQRNFDVAGQLERRLYFDPAGLVRATWGEEPEAPLGLVRGALHRALSAVQPFDLTWTNQRGSSFERSPLEPGYRYRLGLGSMGSLRLVEGDTAVTATARTGFQARSGIRLPLDLQLDATYARNERSGISARGSDNAVTDRTWPDVRLGASTLPIPAAIENVLSRASASVGYRVESTQQDAGTLHTNREAESVPVQFTTIFSNGMSASYTAAFGTSESRETTGRRRGTDRLHGIQVRATIPAPESLGPRFSEPVTASLGFNYTSSRVCQQSGFNRPEGATRCAATVDRLSRDVHFTLETMLDDLNIGAQFSLNDHQSFVGLRDGQREFRLAIFANFNFGVGVLPDNFGASNPGF